MQTGGLFSDFTTAGILSSLLVGSVGYVLFHYGRKSARMPQMVGGLTLLVFPMFVTGTAWMLSIAVVVLAAIWFLIRAGL